MNLGSQFGQRIVVLVSLAHLIHLAANLQRNALNFSFDVIFTGGNRLGNSYCTQCKINLHCFLRLGAQIFDEALCSLTSCRQPLINRNTLRLKLFDSVAHSCLQIAGNHCFRNFNRHEFCQRSSRALNKHAACLIEFDLLESLAQRSLPCINRFKFRNVLGNPLIGQLVEHHLLHFFYNDSHLSNVGRSIWCFRIRNSRSQLFAGQFLVKACRHPTFTNFVRPVFNVESWHWSTFASSAQVERHMVTLRNRATSFYIFEHTMS